jgi:hypothetical protein
MLADCDLGVHDRKYGRILDCRQQANARFQVDSSSKRDSAIYRQLTGERESRACPKHREVTYNPVSREPRDARCVGPSFRVRNDMADLSKNRVCCGRAAGHFVGSQGASRAIGPAGAAMVFSSRCPAPRIFHRWPGVWRNGQTYFRHAESRTNWKNEGICHHKMATKRDSTG